MGALKYWIWLSGRSKQVGTHAHFILKHFGSPEAAYAADEAAYALVPHLSESVRTALMDKSLERAERILADCERLHIRILTMADTEYPERLRQIPDPPCLLYVKGQLPQMDDEVAIGLVGTREATQYGWKAAKVLAQELARQGAVIVSGSARGIDGAGLEGALLGGGRVVSVLGNGIDVIYPQSNRKLYEDIPFQGALVSEHPPGTEPDGAHFPIRNRIISGLSLGVLVIEGQERSGSLITARRALEQNRDVFALPGNWDAIMSRGPNLLIQRAEAKLVMDAWDVLEEYRYAYPHKIYPRMPLPQTAVEPVAVPHTAIQVAAQPAVPALPVLDLAKEPEALTDDERVILLHLQDQICTGDMLIEASDIPAKRIMTALTLLQLRGLVLEEAGKRFRAGVIVRDTRPNQAQTGCNESAT